MFYKNTSSFSKTFWGVTFKPGEIKEVPGYINHEKFTLVKSIPQEPPKDVECKDKPKKKVSKKEERKTSEANQEIQCEQEEKLDGENSNQ